MNWRAKICPPLLAIGGLGLVSVSAAAEVASGTNLYGGRTSSGLSPSPWSDFTLVSFFRVVGGLLIVLALIVAGAMWFRKSRFFGMVRGTENRLRILESRSLGNRNSLVVVGYEQQRLLLSVSPTGAHLVSMLPDSTLPAAGSGQPSPFEQDLKQAELKK